MAIKNKTDLTLDVLDILQKEGHERPGEDDEDGMLPEDEEALEDESQKRKSETPIRSRPQPDFKTRMAIKKPPAP